LLGRRGLTPAPRVVDVAGTVINIAENCLPGSLAFGSRVVMVMRVQGTTGNEAGTPMGMRRQVAT
ncbi:MAG: hypothetical protein QGI41_09015, partial [Acidimicrobiales bacterium]|nr:hypothetical protein [Acidimicrobiales bacterium]